MLCRRHKHNSRKWEISAELTKLNIEINFENSKTIIVGNTDKKHDIEIHWTEMESVVKFKYLKSIVNSEWNLEDKINKKIEKQKNIYASKIQFLAKKFPKRSNSQRPEWFEGYSN